MNAIKGLGIFLALAVLAVAVYLGVWWLRKDSVNRTAEINEDSYGRQVALVDEVLDAANDINRVDVAIANASPEQAGALQGQRQALVETMCDAYGRITGKVNLTPSAQTLITKECL